MSERRQVAAARKSWHAVIAIAILAGAAAIGSHWIPASGESAQQPAANSAPAVPVTLAAVATKDMPVWVGGIGSVVPINVVDVKSRVDGQLEATPFVEGQPVKQGDLLAQIDPRPFKALLDQATATRQKDMAQLGDIRTQLGRSGQLAKLGAATTQSVDTLKAQEASDIALIASDDAAIETAKLNLDFTHITAPIDGRTGLREVNPGALVHATDVTGIVTVTQLKPISVIFSLPQDILPAIRSAQGRGTLDVSVSSRDGTQNVNGGTLKFIDSQIDVASGQIKLKAVFPNKDEVLWPGQFVAVRLLLRTERDALTVPTQAIQHGETGDYVYKVGVDSAVQPVTVKPGAAADGDTVVTGALTTGDRIVLDGQSRLDTGAKVTEIARTAGATP